MIESIRIEYRELGFEKWNLFKYIEITRDDSTESLRFLLEKSFAKYYEFRTVILVNSFLPTIVQYDSVKKDWVEVPYAKK